MRYTAIDLFAGAGGASQGLRDAGFDVLAAVENDPLAAASYEMNHPQVLLYAGDIRKLPATAMMRQLDLCAGELSLLKACPPCQGFSSLAEGRAAVDDERNDLVLHTVRFVRAFRPEAVLVENVPGLGRDRRAQALADSLRVLGYAVRQYKVDAVDFGVPQRRKRLIILARRGLRASLPDDLPSHGWDGEVTHDTSVRTAFEDLAVVLDPDDVLNRARALTPTVRRRVEAIPLGGSRFDLPADLRLACHERLDQSTRAATGAYGRVSLDGPAPTMTTRCTTVSCGRFIHPTEPRGLTLREAATLQTFPPTYRFAGGYDAIERQIGNAVPVKMAKGMGKAVLDLLSA